MPFVNFLQTSSHFNKHHFKTVILIKAIMERPTGTSKDPLFHKSNKNTGKKCKLNLFRTLGIIQRITTVQGVFIQEKWLNFSKNSELCGVLTWPIPVSLVFVSYCFCNKLPRTQCLKTAQIYHLTFLRVRSLTRVSLD